MANLNTALSPAPQVTCFTLGDQVASGFTGNVTVSLASNPTGATLGGTTTIAASSGVATFSNLTLNRSGKNFTLRAVATDLRTTVSPPFSIPTECVFTTQPSSVAVDTNFGCVVTVRDGAGNTDTAYNGVVSIAIYTRTASGSLSGTTTVNAVSGVATFSGLQIDEEGSYTLLATASEVATAYPPAPVVSNSFSIGAYVLTAVDLGSDTFGKDTISGSISPTTYLGFSIRQVKNAVVNPGDDTVTFALSGAHAQNLFTTITINSQTFTSASATFNGVNTWEWNTPSGPITAPGTYTVSFT